MRRFTAAIFVILLFAAFPLQADDPVNAPQRYRLSFGAGEGDAVNATTAFEIAIDVRTGEGAPKPVAFSTANREEEQYSERVLTANAKGPTALRRHYSLYSDKDVDSDSKEKVDTSLQGRTFTIRRVNGKVVVAPAKGIPAKHIEHLKDALDNTATRQFYPNRPLAVGDTWAMDVKEIAKAFPGASKAVVHGKLEEITTYRGLQCARVHAELIVEGKLAGTPATMKMNLSGELMQSLEPQRAISISLAGPITIAGTGKVDGILLIMTGQGSGTLKYEMSEIAGKPLPAAEG